MVKKQRIFVILVAAITIILSACGTEAKKHSSGTAEYTQSSLCKVSVKKIVESAGANNPVVFSHRGTIQDNPEHSFAGYSQAIKDGSAFIEQDVWLSKDGNLYVSHDDNLFRTTGENISISDSTANQLSKVRLRNGEHLHPLSTVFNKYKSNVHYIIEAKSIGKNIKTEQELARTIVKNHMANNVIVQDFYVKGSIALHSAKGMNQVPILQLMNGATESKLISEIDHLPPYIQFVSLPIGYLTKNVRSEIHRRGFLTNVFTISEYSDNFSAFKDEKPDSAFTNETKVTLKYLSSHNLLDGK